MNDKQIEKLVRQLIEENLPDEAVEAALEWLDKCVNAYQEMQEIGLLDGERMTFANTRWPARCLA